MSKGKDDYRTSHTYEAARAAWVGCVPELHCKQGVSCMSPSAGNMVMFFFPLRHGYFSSKADKTGLPRFFFVFVVAVRRRIAKWL